MPSVAALLLWPALLTAHPRGAVPGLTARRIADAIELDGRLDEPAWRAALPFTAFVQNFPREGAPPSERTEVRILHDDDRLYVGFTCFDSRPERIARGMGPRDHPPPSDYVDISIDAAHDHRTARTFGVTAGGVLVDTLHFDDDQSTDTWDAVWDARVHVHPHGWTAELVIPLSIFRGTDSPTDAWGVLAYRAIHRTHEELSTALMPRASPTVVSRFGHLTGTAGLARRRSFAFLPYAAARIVRRPLATDPARPRPRITDPSLDVGLDVRAKLGAALELNAAINPDFGQVEADQLILNLSNQEAFFPEKRPFFFQGTEVFEPVAPDSEAAQNQRLFYSRRMGLVTPILGALKLTGEVADRLEVGIMNVLVTGPTGLRDDEVAPDRRVRWHPRRPLHLAPNDEVARVPGLTQNFFAGVAHLRVSDRSRVGARLASGLPLGARCPPEAEGLDPRPPACATIGGHAAALDLDLRTGGGDWVVMGEAQGSQTAAGPRVRVLPDGTQVLRGTRGFGGYLHAGKIGGEPFRFTVDAAHMSPTLELNAAGFQPTQNQASLALAATYIRPRGFANGFAGLHEFSATLSASQQLSTDGRRIDRGSHLGIDMEATLPGFHTLEVEAGWSPAHFDVREIDGTGIAFERPATGYVLIGGGTDQHRAISVGGLSAWGWHPATPHSGAGWGFTHDMNAAVRPSNRFETRINVFWDRTLHGPRWTERTIATSEVGTGAGAAASNLYLFGDLISDALSVTLRQQVVLRARLVAQAYLQLFTAFGTYQSFAEGAAAARGKLTLTDLQGSSRTEPGFHETGLAVNLVLRWEHRIGSNVYLVYTHSGAGLPHTEGSPPPATLRAVGLLRGSATDAVLVKWSTWWEP